MCQYATIDMAGIGAYLLGSNIWQCRESSCMHKRVCGKHLVSFMHILIITARRNAINETFQFSPREDILQVTCLYEMEILDPMHKTIYIQFIDIICIIIHVLQKDINKQLTNSRIIINLCFQLFHQKIPLWNLSMPLGIRIPVLFTGWFHAKKRLVQHIS